MDLNEVFQNTSSKKSPASTVAVAFGTLVSGLGIGLTAVSLPFIFPFFRRVCLPYVPATDKQISNVLEALRGRSGTLIDLGSGDGRIVFATAKKGFKSTGLELNPWLVIYSKLTAYYLKLNGKTKFLKCDLWKFDLKPYNNVVIFGVDSMMEELEVKFLKELEKDSYIIACRFPLNNIKPIKTIGLGIDTVWVYEIK
ncbi:conserved hypothetical protein [Pediculus humanus corporis]|uniref:Protein FAM173B n=1 Tax=Pediculus humanus subsp. corporis TaxID=121224 RepID=E0VFG3_PEDHC|nr:uncharacterized protein Phum_PHUM156980 [Pediculus humanus corporis]EEB12119.1 conserved hypothetical protein [Pediculus humanus corporis]